MFIFIFNTAVKTAAFLYSSAAHIQASEDYGVSASSSRSTSSLEKEKNHNGASKKREPIRLHVDDDLSEDSKDYIESAQKVFHGTNTSTPSIHEINLDAPFAPFTPGLPGLISPNPSKVN